MLFRKRIPRHCLIIDDPRFQPQFRPRKRSKLKWVFISCFLVLISIGAAELARADETLLTSVNEAETGQILFPLATGGFQQAVHLQSQVSVDINGMVAKVSYQQRFKNDSDEWREAVYVFPLAENAAVNEMAMRIGDRLIRSQIKEKAEARKIYEQAKSQGKKTALTEQQRPNLFTQKVANIAPGEEIEVQISYLQQVGYDSGRFSFYLPTTLTPRFMPGELLSNQVTLDELEPEKHLVSSPFGWATATDQVPDAHEISPFMTFEPGNGIRNPIEIQITLNPGLELADISSRNHQISQHKNPSNYRINLSKQRVSMDRDFWLEWVPVPSQQPEAAVFQEQFRGEDYAMLMLVPPAVTAAEQDLPRDVTFIIDTSGSMGGASIEQAKSSLQLALSRLDEKDRFNIIEFNSNYNKLFHQSAYATPKHLRIASNFVHQLNAGGGTNMAPALTAALRADTDPNLLKQILFITDGAVGNEEQLFALIKTELGDARLFTVGIGSAPNSHFMTRAAQFGRGSFEYISNPNEVAERMSNLFRKLESPVLSNLRIQFPTELNQQLEQYPQRLPDLYSGEPLILKIKALESADLSGEIHISGTVATGSDSENAAHANWTRSIQLKPQPSNSTHQATGISTLWARSKVAALMDEKAMGRPETEVKAEVLSVALPHKLVTKYSSLVAVEERIARKAEAPLKPGAVPNSIAKGQHPQQQATVHGYPQTASWISFNLFIGNICLLLLLGLYRHNLAKLLLRQKLIQKLESRSWPKRP